MELAPEQYQICNLLLWVQRATARARRPLAIPWWDVSCWCTSHKRWVHFHPNKPERAFTHLIREWKKNPPESKNKCVLAIDGCRYWKPHQVLWNMPTTPTYTAEGDTHPSWNTNSTMGNTRCRFVFNLKVRTTSSLLITIRNSSSPGRL